MNTKGITAAIVIGLSGCYPVGWDDWRLVPGVSHIAEVMPGEAYTFPGGVTVYIENYGSECLQRHEDIHKRQARRLNIAASLGGWITGELESEAVLGQECCNYNRVAWDAGGCWGDPDHDDWLAGLGR